jgi:hypothetical protein
VALGVFFLAGAAVAAVAAASLALPGGLLGRIWRLKPEAQPALAGLGLGAVLLMAAVAIACALAAIGLWRGFRWAHGLAAALLAINLIGAALQATVRGDPRAWLGVPISLLLLAYLWSGEVRHYFRVRGG